MATVVHFEDLVTAVNRQDVGLISVYRSTCPDLHAATQQTARENERLLPVGWKVQYLVDSKTGEDKGRAIKAPNGRTWDPEKCSGVGLDTPSLGWSWFVVAGAALAYYLFTRKK